MLTILCRYWVIPFLVYYRFLNLRLYRQSVVRVANSLTNYFWNNHQATIKDVLSTYPIDMPQCFPARLNPSDATDSPINIIVGATVNGPINRRSMLTNPVAPMRISIIAATMMDPVNWNIYLYRSCHGQGQTESNVNESWHQW